MEEEMEREWSRINAPQALRTFYLLLFTFYFPSGTERVLRTLPVDRTRVCAMGGG